jgi:hypothetical protein
MTWQSGAFNLSILLLPAARWPSHRLCKPRSRAFVAAATSASFRWRIANWAAVSAAEADRRRSAAFSAGGLPWRLLLFPRGNPTPPRRPAVTDHLSLYVEYAGGEPTEPAAVDDARIALTILRRGAAPPAPKTSRPHFTQRACTEHARRDTRTRDGLSASVTRRRRRQQLGVCAHAPARGLSGPCARLARRGWRADGGGALRAHERGGACVQLLAHACSTLKLVARIGRRCCRQTSRLRRLAGRARRHWVSTGRDAAAMMRGGCDALLGRTLSARAGTRPAQRPMRP